MAMSTTNAALAFASGLLSGFTGAREKETARSREGLTILINSAISSGRPEALSALDPKLLKTHGFDRLMPVYVDLATTVKQDVAQRRELVGEQIGTAKVGREKQELELATGRKKEKIISGLSPEKQMEVRVPEITQARAATAQARVSELTADEAQQRLNALNEMVGDKRLRAMFPQLAQAEAAITSANAAMVQARAKQAEVGQMAPIRAAEARGAGLKADIEQMTVGELEAMGPGEARRRELLRTSGRIAEVEAVGKIEEKKLFTQADLNLRNDLKRIEVQNNADIKTVVQRAMQERETLGEAEALRRGTLRMESAIRFGDKMHEMRIMHGYTTEQLKQKFGFDEELLKQAETLRVAREKTLMKEEYAAKAILLEQTGRIEEKKVATQADLSLRNDLKRIEVQNNADIKTVVQRAVQERETLGEAEALRRGTLKMESAIRFGDKLREMRIAHGYTIEQLKQKFGFDEELLKQAESLRIARQKTEAADRMALMKEEYREKSTLLEQEGIYKVTEKANDFKNRIDLLREEMRLRRELEVDLQKGKERTEAVQITGRALSEVGRLQAAYSSQLSKMSARTKVNNKFIFGSEEEANNFATSLNATVAELNSVKSLYNQYSAAKNLPETSPFIVVPRGGRWSRQWALIPAEEMGISGAGGDVLGREIELFKKKGIPAITPAPGTITPSTP